MAHELLENIECSESNDQNFEVFGPTICGLEVPPFVGTSGSSSRDSLHSTTCGRISSHHLWVSTGSRSLKLLNELETRLLTAVVCLLACYGRAADEI